MISMTVLPPHGVIHGWLNEYETHAGETCPDEECEIVISSGAVIFHNGHHWDNNEEQTLFVPDDGNWYTVAQVIYPVEPRGWLVSLELLPGLSWDYDLGKEPLAQMTRLAEQNMQFWNDMQSQFFKAAGFTSSKKKTKK